MLIDQRGCGRSRPHASETGDLSANTTWHLVADLERLRVARGIERWQVFGGSWGSALALAYAETHPERVTELVLRGIFTLRRSRAGLLLQRWRRAAVPGPLRGVPRAVRAAGGSRGDPIAAYHDLLFDPDPAVHGPAAVAWSTWEAATITLRPDAELIASFAEPAYALAFARIENHYFTHGGWFTDGQLIADAHRLRDIPGVIVQGRYDVATPAVTAWDLHRAWPEADLQLIGDAGHAYSEPGITAALVAATDRFASRALTHFDARGGPKTAERVGHAGHRLGGSGGGGRPGPWRCREPASRSRRGIPSTARRGLLRDAEPLGRRECTSARTARFPGVGDDELRVWPGPWAGPTPG